MAAPEFFASSIFAEPLATFYRGRRSRLRELFRLAVVISEILADVITYVFCIFITYFSLHAVRQIEYPLREVAAVGIVCGLFGVFLLQRDGAYQGIGSLLQISEMERAIRIPAQSLLLLLPASFFLGSSYISATLLFVLLLMPLLLLQKQALLLILGAFHVRQYGVDRVVIYGAGDAGARIVSTLLYSPKLGLHPVVVVDDNPALTGEHIFEMGYQRSRSVPVQVGPVTPALLKSCQCDLLMVTASNLSSEKLAAITHATVQAGIRIAFIPGQSLSDCELTKPINLDGLLLTSIVESATSWLYAVAKRAVDLIISSLLLVGLAPLLLLIAAFVRMDSCGPALFIQKRVGRDGVLFDMYKFRSMHTSVPRYECSPKKSSDPRITKIGKFLRRNSLDELPQLINVFLGNMSLVGPRPEMPFIVQSYNSTHRMRLQVVPGITGLWQLSAARAFSIHENIQYDLYYIRNRNFSMDMAILVHTLFFAMRGGI